MRRRLTLTARARTDLAQVKLWSAQIRPEAGGRFLGRHRQDFEAIRERPTSFAEVESGVRRGLCDSFPYKVYFRLKDDGEVRVLAVYHVSRDPGKWLDRE
jgi:plasmid stabilization system protein ParE